MKDDIVFDVDEVLAFARIDMDNNSYEKALKKLLFVLRCDDFPNETFSMIAQLYAQIGLFQKSEAMFRKFIEQSGDAVVERFQLGMTMFDQKRYEDAVSEWDKLLLSENEYPPALFYMGLALTYLKRREEAKRYLETILSTVNGDNLYFTRANDLLAEINILSSSKDKKEELSTIINNDAYKTVQ